MSSFANIGSIFKPSLFNRRLFATIILAVVILLCGNVYAQRGVKISTIVIDAGHGGKDPGALGKHSREKVVSPHKNNNGQNKGGANINNTRFFHNPDFS